MHSWLNSPQLGNYSTSFHFHYITVSEVKLKRLAIGILNFSNTLFKLENIPVAMKSVIAIVSKWQVTINSVLQSKNWSVFGVMVLKFC